MIGSLPGDVTSVYTFTADAVVERGGFVPRVQVTSQLQAAAVGDTPWTASEYFVSDPRRSLSSRNLKMADPLDFQEGDEEDLSSLNSSYFSDYLSLTLVMICFWAIIAFLVYKIFTIKVNKDQLLLQEYKKKIITSVSAKNKSTGK